MNDTANAAMPTRGYRWVLLGGIWLVYFCFGLIAASMAPLLSRIAVDLDIDYATIGAILGAWPLVYIAAAIPCGALLDTMSPRLTMFIGCIIIGVSGILRGVAQSDLTMFLAVGVFGVGGPLISIGAPKLISLWFDDKSRGAAMGVYITGPALGNAVALAATNSLVLPLAGGDWRIVMFVYAAAAFAISLLWLAIASHPNAGNSKLHSDGVQFSLSAMSEILSVPTVRVVLLMAIGVFFINHGINNWLPEMLRFKGQSAAEAGFWSSVPTIVGIAGSLLIPRFATPERRIPLLLGLFVSVLLSSLLLQASNSAPLFTALILFGVGRGALMAVVMLVLMSSPDVPRKRLGLAGGMFFVAAELGGVLGPVTMGVLSDWTGGFSAPVFSVTVVSLALVLLATSLLLRRRASES